ncbi:MAG TPA: tetratricopeptide repeat protein [Pseudomonadales bacterium]
MATYGSDEEQLEALKRWWNDNGTSLLVGIAIVLAVFFGVRQWQGMQLNSSGVASDLYQQIADLAIANTQQPITEQGLVGAQAIFATLKNEHTDSVYTRYAALAMASFHVEHDELDMAAAELQWILDNPKIGLMTEVDEELLLTARSRLARIRIAQDMPQEAIDLLHAVEPGAFAGSYAEIEGDALVALGQTEEARAAYERALAGLGTGNPVLLQLKLQDLGVSPLGSSNEPQASSTTAQQAASTGTQAVSSDPQAASTETPAASTDAQAASTDTQAASTDSQAASTDAQGSPNE